jgi:GT2 family glycosyltransferase
VSVKRRRPDIQVASTAYSGHVHVAASDGQPESRRGVRRRVRPVRSLRRPTVSVVVPCYNYARYLRDAVDSVLSQEGVDVDVLIVDDYSSDGSAEVASSLAAGDERVRVVVHRQNVGHIATYNEGLSSVTGEFVVLLSADDMLSPGALARATSLMEARPNVAFVYGYPIDFEGPVPVARQRVRSWTTWSGGEWIARRCRRATNCVRSPEVVMRASVQRAIGGYRADLPHSGDLEMWLRAAGAGEVGRVNGAAQAYYRTHPASMSRTSYSGALVDLTARRDAFGAFFDEATHPLPDAQRLHEKAQRALAIEALRLAARSLERGIPGEELVDDYERFAVDVWPAVRRTGAWRGVQLRRRLASQWQRGPKLLARPAIIVDLADRIRWRLWRLNGE